MIAPTSDLDLFILPYMDDEDAEVDVEILDVYQPFIRSHEKNLEFLNSLKKQEGTDE